VSAYSPERWTDLFVASAGASAALTGLVFVAVSINIERILRYPGLPERALQTILLLLSLVVVSIFALVPGQSLTTLGVELTGASLAYLGAVIFLFRASRRASFASGEEYHPFSQLVTSMPGALLFLASGASVMAEGGGGLYLTLAGLILALVGTVLNAWVLLVEILR
jgi:modulator of FtsH protease